MSTVCLLLRQEREDEKRRLRVKFITSTLYKVNMTCNKPMFCLNKQEQKKVQEQPHVEQDTAFSTRPSPARPVSAKKPVGARASNGGANGTPNRRLSLNANQNGSMSVAKEGGRSVCNFTRNDIKALQIQFMLTKKPNPFRIGQANGEKCGLQYAYLMHRILCLIFYCSLRLVTNTYVMGLLHKSSIYIIYMCVCISVCSMFIFHL